MAKVTFPQAGNDFVKNNGSDTVFNTEGPSLTRQEFAEECDINSLMKRYEQHGTSINGLRPEAQPMYINFTEMPDNLIDYLGMLKDAENAFMTLPAGVRREFDNDSIAFVDFASDPNNLDQMRTWGLAPPAKPLEEGQPDVSTAPAPPAPPSAASAPGGAPAAPQGASTHGST